jgi:hypothetical protein
MRSRRVENARPDDVVAAATDRLRSTDVAASEAVLSRLATADADTRGAALGRLQRGVGNAGIARLLARRQAVESFDHDSESLPDGPGIEPHAPGQDSDTPQVLAEAAAGKGAAGGELDGTIALEESETTAAPDREAPELERQPAGQAPPANANVATWAGRAVATNPDYARWLLDAEPLGFVKFSWNSKQQLETFAAGRKHSMTGTTGGNTEIGGTIDGASTTLLPVLETARGIVSARAGRWMADPTKPKQPLTLLWLARNWPGGDAHSQAQSLDAAGGIDFGNARAGAQVIQILDDLPAGDYWIGLPYQQPFFDPRDSLLHYTNEAEHTAKSTGADPADVTVPALVEWKLVHYTATWNKSARKWVQKPGSTPATSKLTDTALRAAFAGGNGKTFAAFPDRPNHIHIQRV